MKNKELKLINEYNFIEETWSYLEKKDLSDRIGYDSKFIDDAFEVKLPILTNERFGPIATNNSPNRNGENYLDYKHFSTMHNKKYKLPYFTAVNNLGTSNYLAMDHDERSGDRWHQDERIQSVGNLNQYDDKDYYKSGFQKGHMVRYYDPAWGKSEEEMKIAIGDTFYYTNACPQKAGFNVGAWLDLENYSMVKAVFDTGKVSVFCGPVFNNVLNFNGLNVPVTFWKVLVYKEKDELKAVGFLMSQKVAYDKRSNLILEFAKAEKEKIPTSLKPEDIDHLFNKRNLKRYMVRIDLIEEKTGLSFDLNHIDINQSKEKMFFEDVDYKFRQQASRLKFLVEYNQFDRETEDFNDLEFIKTL